MTIQVGNKYVLTLQWEGEDSTFDVTASPTSINEAGEVRFEPDPKSKAPGLTVACLRSRPGRTYPLIVGHVLLAEFDHTKPKKPGWYWIRPRGSTGFAPRNVVWYPEVGRLMVDIYQDGRIIPEELENFEFNGNLDETNPETRGTGKTTRMLEFSSRLVADGKDIAIVATSETMARILSDQCRKMAEQKKGEKTLGKIHAVGPTSTLRGLPRETRVVFDHTLFERVMGDSNLFRLLDESRMLEVLDFSARKG